MDRTELDVIVEQLDELLAEGPVDEEEALELVCLAGSAERLGCDPTWLDGARAWRDGKGAGLLEEAWGAVDLTAMVAAVDEASCGDLSDEEVEAVMLDVDDLFTAAVFCGEKARVRPAAVSVERIVRELPDMFLELGPYAVEMVANRWVIDHDDVYGFWLAIAESLPADD